MENWQVILLLVGVSGFFILFFVLVGLEWAKLDESKWPGNSRLAHMIREIKGDIRDAKGSGKRPKRPERPKKFNCRDCKGEKMK